MKRRLPPLNALRTFEAAASHLNFTHAADELAVTPTAVSHQIRQLEDWFGTALFVRGRRRMQLTEAGAHLYPAMAETLDRIAEVACRIRDARDRTTLTVSVTPTFGSRWLAARLGGFWQEYPDIDLRLHHSHSLVDFSRDDVDLAVRWGMGNWANTRVEKLMDGVTVPMCSPALLGGDHPLKTLNDLKYHVLLHDADHHEWIEWLKAAGVDDVDGQRGPVLDDPNTMVKAAIAGHGVLLGTTSMMSAELENGQLVRPFGDTSGIEPAYYLVYKQDATRQFKVQAFREFILSEVEQYLKSETRSQTSSIGALHAN